ncbi:glycosyltransferase family 2 protein [Polycyclovorans algicola]|uniref:glycosyltransferase family 2 protein n=1 Tax=Polycyclovorans algicola TaxID=616992 RepID=UPI0004A77D48|nr:glycosyltransferase [Polycyclovorans algicola]
MTPPLHFYIFSFNRGRFLAHCVRSIETCAPGATLTVMDDASDDPETVAVLKRVGECHEVVVRAGGEGSKHGGLSANMQAALDRTDAPRVCFLQDDMQLVRPLDETDAAAINRWFEQRPNAAFLHPAFLKGCNAARDRQITRFDDATGCYLREAERLSVGGHYSDIFIADTARLRAQGWQFTAREHGNEPQARRLFGPMGFMFAPFVMWLPSVPAYRGRSKTRAMQHAERRQGCGFHPLRMMSQAHAEAFRQRDPQQLPVAETFLRLEDAARLTTPWRYHPFQNASLLRNLDKLERSLSRLWSTRG